MSENTVSTSTELSTLEGIGQITKGVSTVVSTLRGNDRDTQIQVLKATMNATPLSEHLGKPINLVHFVAQSIDMTDEETGELVNATRIVLLDADGSAYAAISNGLIKSLQNIVGILGEPATWGQPLPLIVTEAGQGKRKYFTATIAD